MANSEDVKRLLTVTVDDWNKSRRPNFGSRYPYDRTIVDLVIGRRMSSGSSIGIDSLREIPHPSEMRDLSSDHIAGRFTDEQISMGWRHLNYYDFSYCNLSQSNFQRLSFRNVDFFGANLEAANLINAFLWNARLERTKLAKVQMVAADLRDCNFRHANLRSANLAGANLSGSDRILRRSEPRQSRRLQSTRNCSRCHRSPGD